MPCKMADEGEEAGRALPVLMPDPGKFDIWPEVIEESGEVDAFKEPWFGRETSKVAEGPKYGSYEEEGAEEAGGT